MENAPTIHPHLLPDDERDRIFDLNNRLGSLRGYVENYEAALALFDFAASEIQQIIYQRDRDRAANRPLPSGSRVVGPNLEKFERWMGIAARDATITVYNFQEALTTVTNALHKCPTISAMVSQPALKQAKRPLNGFFPEATEARHGVAHAAEFAGKIDEHSISGPLDLPGLKLKADRIYLSGHLSSDRRYAATVNHTVVTCEISKAGLDRLTAVLRGFYAAFRPAEEQTKRMLIEHSMTRPASRPPEDPA